MADCLSTTCVDQGAVPRTRHNLRVVGGGQEFGREYVGPVGGLDITENFLGIRIGENEPVIVRSGQEDGARAVPGHCVDATTMIVQRVDQRKPLEDV